jgi:hypothetical protein
LQKKNIRRIHTFRRETKSGREMIALPVKELTVDPVTGIT